MPGRTARIGGIVILLVVHASFLFLLASPYVTNPFGEGKDLEFLEGVDQRIRQIRTGDITVTLLGPDDQPLAGKQVEFELIRHDFRFGCNIFEFDKFTDPEHNRKYKERFAKLFNLAVVPFYWGDYEPEKGNLPMVARLDIIINWCEQQGIEPKGHPLSWRNPHGYPRWLPADDSQVAVATALKTRIQREVERFRGRIKIWDVVNEPTHLPTFGGQTLFDYVNNALTWAAEPDPKARLCVNDYGILGRDYGSGPYFDLLTRLIEAKAPLGIVGFESHEPRTDWIPATEIWETLEAYSKLGLPIHSTELTVPSGNLPITNSWMKGLWTEERQAEYVERFYKTFFSHPAVGAVIYWDLYDGRAWVQKGALIDVNFEPKEVYRRLDNLINREWHTQGKATTDAQGRIGFNGFYGTYRIALPESEQTFEIRVPRGGQKEFTVKQPEK
jgi:GH35 family endo-1,4-beta-xylanase